MNEELGGQKSASSSSLLLFVLCTTFGIASWLGVNGLWVELPVLVDRLPESWNLPSYYTVVISIGNLLPLAYVAWRRWTRKGGDRPISPRGLRNERALIMTVLLLQLLAIVLLIFTWHETIEGHSVALLALLLVVSVADCSSSVFFLPYMAHFPHVYLSAYYAGASLSGLLPGLVVLGQGVNGKPYCRTSTRMDPASHVTITSVDVVYPPPRFGPGVFFGVLGGMTLASLVAFAMLGLFDHGAAQPGHALSGMAGDEGRAEQEGEEDICQTEAVACEVWSLGGGGSKAPGGYTCCPSGSPARPQERVEEAGRGWGLAWSLGVIALVNALGNGVLPSVQSYSTLPFGTTSYHLAVSLSSVFNTVASLALAAVPTSPRLTRTLPSLLLVFLGLGLWILIAAIRSPDPPLKDTAFGAFLAVFSWVGLNGLFTLIKVYIARLMQASGGRTNLLYIGVVTQVASMVGSLLMFPLINVYGVFKATPGFSCPPTA